MVKIWYFLPLLSKIQSYEYLDHHSYNSIPLKNQLSRSLPKEKSTNPSAHPSSKPSVIPSLRPSFTLTVAPTSHPTSHPTVNPTVNPTSNPTINPTLDPSSHATSFPSNVSKKPTFKPTRTSTSDEHILEILIPLQPFSLGFIFPSSSAVNEIDFQMITELVGSFLSEYMSNNWELFNFDPPLDKNDEEQLKLYEHKMIQLKLTTSVSNRRLGIQKGFDEVQYQKKQKKVYRSLQNNVSQIVSTWFTGKAVVVSPSLSSSENSSSFIQDEHILRHLRAKIYMLQEEALTGHLNKLVTLLQTNTVGENPDVLKDVQNILSLIETQPVEPDIQDNNIAQQGDANTINNDNPNDLITSNPNINSSGKNRKLMTIILGIVTGIVCIAIIIFTFIFLKRKKRNQKKQRNDSDNSFSDFAYNFEQEKGRRFSFKNRKKNDDISTVGFERTRSGKTSDKDFDEFSQVSYSYSVEGESIREMKAPKYTRNEYEYDDDTSSDFDLHTHGKERNSSFNKKDDSFRDSNLSDQDDLSSIWTFSKLGDDVTMEGVEVFHESASTIARKTLDRSHTGGDDSVYGFTKYNNDAFSYVESTRSVTSALTLDTDANSVAKQRSRPNVPESLYENDYVLDSAASNRSFSSIDRYPINGRKNNNMRSIEKQMQSYTQNINPSPVSNRRNWTNQNSDNHSDAPSDECTLSHQNLRSFDEMDDNSRSIIKDLNALKNVIDARYNQ